MIYALEDFLDFIYSTQEGRTTFDFVEFREMLKLKEQRGEIKNKKE